MRKFGYLFATWVLWGSVHPRKSQAKDVVSFAQEEGLYPRTGKSEEFSFSDIYDPPTFSGVRMGEARVWDIFQRASGGAFEEYLPYAQGYDLAKRMPLFAKAALGLGTPRPQNGSRRWAETRRCSAAKNDPEP